MSYSSALLANVPTVRPRRFKVVSGTRGNLRAVNGTSPRRMRRAKTVRRNHSNQLAFVVPCAAVVVAVVVVEAVAEE